MNTKSHLKLFIIIGVVFAAFSTRSPTSGIGPLIPIIQLDLGISSGLSGMLTTIPLILYSAVAAAAWLLPQHFQMRTQILFGLACSILGVLVRSYFGMWGLLIGTVLVGVGIGILHVVMPPFLRAHFPEKIGLVMGLYTTCITVFSAIATGYVLWLSDALGGWRNALGIFAVIPMIAILVWLPIRDASNSSQLTNNPRESSGGIPGIITERSYILIALFMGFQSFLFFTMVTWLPSIMMASGMHGSYAAMLVMVSQLVGCITRFIFPQLAQHRPALRGLIGLSGGLCYLAGYLIILASSSLCLLWVGGILAGFGNGISFSIALTFVALKSKTQAESMRLSGFSMTFGYAFAAIGPFLLGFLHDITETFTASIIVILAVSVAMCYVGKKSGDDLR